MDSGCSLGEDTVVSRKYFEPFEQSVRGERRVPTAGAHVSHSQPQVAPCLPLTRDGDDGVLCGAVARR